MAIDPYKTALKEVKDRFDDKKIQYVKDPVFSVEEIEELDKMRVDWKKMEEEKKNEKNK